MKKNFYIKNFVLAAVMAGMTLSYTACGDDDENPTPDKQEQNKDNNQKQGDENKDNNQNQGNENTTKYKISFVVEGEKDKITLSETSKEVAVGEKVKITYELQEGFAIYEVGGSGFNDAETKTISATCLGANQEITITVKSIYNKVTVLLTNNDGTLEVVNEGNYKNGDKIEYELASKYKGYYISFVKVSDPSMGRDFDYNKATITLNDITEDCNATIELSECKVSLEIYQDNKKVSTLTLNKLELNKEYEHDITDLIDGYDFKEIKTYDDIDAKVENGKIKVTVNKYGQHSAEVHLEKAKFPVFTDSKKSILGKTFDAWTKGLSFVKTTDGIIMNYYEKVENEVKLTRVYTFEKYDDWANIFSYNDVKYYIYITSEGENAYRVQITEYMGSKTEILSISEVASVEEMKSSILSRN